MKWYRADLHIHTVLSPCGDLDMSPAQIIKTAKEKELDIIGITDHNSTLHTELTVELGLKEGITVFPGVEISTREEVHCLAFFENIEVTKEFQEYLEIYGTNIPNKESIFGNQLVVNEAEEIILEIPNLLIAGLNSGIEEIETKVHELNGVFIPAHIDRKNTSIYSQIGFIPKSLKIDALEFSRNSSVSAIRNTRKELGNYNLITNSDAHYIDQIGKATTEYYLNEPTFGEWKMAIKNSNGRKIRIV